MRKSIILMMLFVCAAAGAHAQTYNESSGGQAIIGSGNQNTTYYAPAFAYGESNCNKYDRNGNLITGDCVFLYVQGDDSLSDTTYLDQILMYWNPNTWTGLTTQFAGNTRLLPSTDYLGNAHQTYAHYGHPSVFGYNGNYYMTAHQSPDAVNFKKHWWGVSADGKTWTWYPLFDYTGSGNLNIPGVSLQPRLIGTQMYFYGFMEVISNAGYGIGAIRLRVNTGTARGYDKVEMYSGGSWVQIVDPATNPSGTFSTTIPDKIIDARSNPKYLENGELWTTVLNGFKNCSICGSTSGSEQSWADRFAVIPVNAPASTTSAPSFSTESAVTSSVRCMPGLYDNSRTYPMPLATGSPRLVYSATNDADYGSGSHCGVNGLDTFPGMYIVVTGF